MNLSDERNYQKRYEILENMELSEANRNLGEEYLDPANPEQRELLKKAERQDFSRLDKEKAGKCTAYLEHLKKRARMEEAGRFARFCAAVGGSTAYYVLVSYGWSLNTLIEFLTKEQVAAIQAEGMVWNMHLLREANLKTLYSPGKQDPRILSRAMELCYHKSDNAKVLLAGIYLHLKKPQKSEKTFKKLLFFMQNRLDTAAKGETDGEETADIIAFLENNLIDSISNLFQGAAPSAGDLKEIEDFVRSGRPELPFPDSVHKALAGKQVSPYLLTLLTGTAFLAAEHSARFLSFLRLAMDISLETALNAMINMAGNIWFYDHATLLEDLLPVPAERYITWCLARKAGGPLRRMAAAYPEEIKKAAEKADTEGYHYLVNQVKTANPDLYREMEASYSGEFRNKMADELTARYVLGRTEARLYLLGIEDLDILYPYVNGWRGGWDYDNEKYKKIASLKRPESLSMYQRAIILEALSMHSRYLYITESETGIPVLNFRRNIDRKVIENLLAVFRQESLPVSYQLEALEGIYNGFYQEKDKTNFINECVMALVKDWQNIKETVSISAREGTAVVRFLCIRLLDVHWKEEKELLLSCAADTSKQVRELLAAVCESHREWEPEIKNMLFSKKSQERELALLVLKGWGPERFKEELSQALEKEKSSRLKQLLEEMLGMEKKETGKENAPEDESIKALAARILKGGKKRKVAWALEIPFPPLCQTDGEPAPEDALPALLAAYAELSVPGISQDAARLAAGLDASALSACMGLLFSKWLETGAPAKQKWVLYAASIHGGSEIIPALMRQIQEWPQNARGAMASEAVRALALNGSPEALLLVDQISRKFKFRQVKNAAGEALSYAAGQLGLSREELEDRIVPSLGFDENFEQTFDYGSRSFKTVLTPSLEVEVFDGTGKRLKNLPAPGKRDEEEKARAANAAYKLMKKQLKTVVSNQKLRLEQTLIAKRHWKADKWKELFVKNPVMHQFAIGLIWGTYEEGVLKDTFRYMEDGSFNTVDEEEYELPSDSTIGLVHPVELEEETLTAWKEQLSDYEITQPIEQLLRPVYRPTEEERSQTELIRFGGMLLNGLSLSGKLQSQGWYRGSVEDGGVYSTFYREDGDLGVELEFSGCYVGDENEEITVYGVRFYKAGTVRRGSYAYDTIKKENMFALGKIEPRYFSETVLQLHRATASSKEQLAYPACRN